MPKSLYIIILIENFKYFSSFIFFRAKKRHKHFQNCKFSIFENMTFLVDHENVYTYNKNFKLAKIIKKIAGNICTYSLLVSLKKKTISLWFMVDFVEIDICNGIQFFFLFFPKITSNFYQIFSFIYKLLPRKIKPPQKISQNQHRYNLKC